MASVTGSYRYVDGEQITFSVEVENDYPDALDQAKATCLAALRDITGLEVEREDQG
jgi:hypothetical protein